MSDKWHVIFNSSGIGSWATAKRVAEQYGTDRLIHLFADTKIEDADNYRFLHEAAANVGGHLIKIQDGRSPFTLWRHERAIANNRTPFCSIELKQRISREFLETSQDDWRILSMSDRNRNKPKWQAFWANRHRSGYGKLNLTPENTVLYVGIDWSEVHRLPAIVSAWQPYTVVAPMAEAPYLDKQQMLAWAKAEGLTPPRMYSEGFPHSNCGGKCSRGGQAYWRHTLKVRPADFAEAEAEENAMRGYLGKDVAMLSITRNGIKKPYTLTELRHDVEAKGQIDLFDWGGACPCFTLPIPA